MLVLFCLVLILILPFKSKSRLEKKANHGAPD